MGADWLSERSALVDRYLEGRLPPASEPPAVLHAAMRHLVFPGGKRLRPAFVLAGCEAVGATADAALPAAAAVELVHTYSLIHDDLPCMDDDVERRGRPTVHVAFGEANALLAGDALLALAFEVLADAEGSCGAAAVAWCTRTLATAAGSRQLVGGQVDDLAFAVGGPATLARVESVHRRKSAALIAASVACGARLGNADAALLANLAAFGEEVGVAFQIADDVLDAHQNEACSVVSLLGAGGARARADALLASALKRIERLGEKGAALRMLAEMAVRREK
ncbi:MAG: polyprenyl synthetase family protein [Deltaproteobacteria bacterium]|nr:polyprenyl synthetase family protein [Deltaproteobacteria bacterium]